MRALLLQTAVEHMRQGRVPTVTEVAAKADVSRRTAYRYFPSQDQLLAEAALETARPAIGALPMPADIEGRIDVVVTTVQRFAYENEAALRTLLRLFLQRPLGARPPRRGALTLPLRRHRVESIETGLMPIRELLSRRDLDRLVSAMTLCMGIEAALVLRDLRSLSPTESVEVCRWAATQLVRGALREAKKAAPGRRRR